MNLGGKVMKLDQLQSIGVVGAGQMGRGIAQVAAMNGFKVKLFDVATTQVDTGLTFIKSQMQKGVEKAKWNQDTMDKTMKNLSGSTKLSDFADCQMAIEAASENLTIKKQIFIELDGVLNKDALLVTNTSSISITELAAATKRPTLVAGMHFMNPVPVMKLVEGIKGLETSQETFDLVRAVAEKMGKVFVAAKDYPGFAVNRILMPMINEAVYALYEGVASVQDIDQAMKLGTNQPMGPLELADFIGLDTCLAIMEVLHDGLGDTKYRPCPLLKQYVASGRFGRKNKKGFYEYGI